ncbi:MAG: hypothetical protein HFACDABA_01107 [Anaerolineales bacterium]|nr:hypothetical protein [Anaerolineales bacterium]
MRRRNMRLVFSGLLFLVLASGFFFGMQPLAARSTNPVEFMRLIGQVSGVVGGVSVALIVAGLIGKQEGAKKTK